MNYKGGIVKAYKQFIEDLKQDKDFLEYKKKSKVNIDGKTTLFFHVAMVALSENENPFFGNAKQ